MNVKPTIAQIERQLAAIPMGEAREVYGVLVIVRDCDAAAEIRQYN